MGNFVQLGFSNKLDLHDFEILQGTDLLAKMMKNRLVVYFDVSTPNATVDAVEEFIELNTKALWYKRTGPTSRYVVYYFEQVSEHQYVASMIQQMIK
jgi:hypothetical protein